MAKEAKLFSDYEAKLDRKEKELIAQKKAVRAFRKTRHKSEDTEKYIEALGNTESELEDIMTSLLDLKAMMSSKHRLKNCAEDAPDWIDI